MKTNNGKIYAKYIKRLLDIVISLTFIVLFFWLYLILALLVRIKLGSPILFKQKRPGRDEKIFNMYKFRTMTDERDSDGNLLPDSDRLTTFGRFLRKTSLDELPEMFCILKGDMSPANLPSSASDCCFQSTFTPASHIIGSRVWPLLSSSTSSSFRMQPPASIHRNKHQLNITACRKY